MKKIFLPLLSLLFVLPYGCKQPDPEPDLSERYGTDQTGFEHPDSTPDPVEGFNGKMILRKTIMSFEYGTALPYNRYTVHNRDANWQTKYWKEEQPEYTGFVPDASEEELSYHSTTVWSDLTEGGSNYWVIYAGTNGGKGTVISDFMTYVKRDENYQPDYDVNVEENTLDLTEYTQLQVTIKSTHSEGEEVPFVLSFYDRSSGKTTELIRTELISGRKIDLFLDLSAVPEEDRTRIDYFRFEFPVDLVAGETIRNDVYLIEATNAVAPSNSAEIGGFEVQSEFLGNVLDCPWGAYSASGFYDSSDGKWKMWFGASTAEILAADNIYYIETSDINGHWSKPYRIQLNDPNGVLFAPDVNPGYGGDPSVLKIDGTYYMYFTGLPTGLYDENLDMPFWNKVFLATSSDGKTWDLREEPIIDAYNAGDQLYYGAGGPSAVYKDGVFYLYYWTTSALEDGLTGLLLRTSTDGIHFGEATQIVTSHGGCDVKYLPDYDKWVMIYDYDNTVRLGISDDGINFLLGSGEDQILRQEEKGLLNHNPGLIGNEYGHGYTTMFAVYGVNDLPLAGTGSNMDSRRLEWSRWTIGF